jgi:hypothetical protein
MYVYALTVGRNEAHRYLKEMLSNMYNFVDGHFFFDDQSDDGTLEIAKKFGCVTAQRSIYEPSFLEHEGGFRQTAWNAFEREMHPKEGDWVVVIDCDEMLVWNGIQNRHLLKHELEYLGGMNGVMIDIPEIFGFKDGVPLVRFDGLWGTIHAPRLFPYKLGGQYHMGSMGVPAVPGYVMTGPWGAIQGMYILHYGYAREEDRRAKFERYSAHTDGHAAQHVNSILSEDMQLEPWTGPYIEPWTQSA